MFSDMNRKGGGLRKDPEAVIAARDRALSRSRGTVDASRERSQQAREIL